MMTPPTPLPISRSAACFDPPLAKSPCIIEEDSPAYYQSMRNKQKLAVLERFNDPTGANLPTLNTTPLSNRRDTKLKTPFKVPFIDRLKKADE